MSKVDFPMPGSPPMSVAEPCTIPPPRTRSSSPNPVDMRGGISTRLLSGFITILVPPLDRSCFAEKVVDFAVASSAIEFHSPQSEHCPRSEEHTSELQSLMRISYAVFCLKKKKKQN